MDSECFENVKNQIGFCGIWCGSCAVGNGTLKNLAKRCEHVIEGYGVDEWGARDFDGKEFMKGLTSIQAIPICQGCLKGGGSEVCKIGPCATSKKLSNCMECIEVRTCKNLETLQKVRNGALRVGMLAKTENDDANQQQLLGKWTAEIKSKCPHCGA
ncbi:DUF3795 domain-containing protein [Candidatus Bathyarchaeota archaeon]|nr:DUF3795 domain-containing protein [Candidatus Bathyarchaeota archaeon]